ncbi:MAG: glutathione S-transferase family protein [Pseudomonadota bacterium]|uniref:glutathione S-transferase family protein n=1 Tax=Fodinicurvata fenggangensis TaxID=1121830 RepID=UPI00047B5E14|nr:glutathione S-transferase family protein [Fodinicurvata fenggangensis]
MRLLYHLPLDPGCRKIRLLLAEKGLEVELKTEQVWERRDAFLRLNPAGEVPVLVESDGTILPDAQVIAEYLEETSSEPSLLGSTALDRAEARRLVNWFDRKFAREVSELLIEEKVMKRLLSMGNPDSSAIRAANHNIHHHLDYIGWLAERRNWLAGDHLGLADLTAAAHLSCLDYLDHVPWDQHPGARDWYARIKSRPSMRPILADFLASNPPPKHYADLDF